ncbi:DUF7619 domain-containing protein [Neolewinella persica]|uniref:DUF7619 domain-containing protein n=1 Tax=Neolewinella persica TaxID=70998 RepID=UPI0003616357|nr:MopE-related protein [Neolewinella persica]
MTVNRLTRWVFCLFSFLLVNQLYAQKGGLKVTDIPDPAPLDFPSLARVTDGTFYNLTPNNTLVYKDGGFTLAYRTDGTIAGSGETLDEFAGFFFDPIGSSDSSAWIVHDFSQLLRFDNSLDEPESMLIEDLFYSGLSLPTDQKSIVATDDRIYVNNVRPLFVLPAGRYIMELLEHRYGESGYNTLFSDTLSYDPFLALTYQLGDEVVFSRYANWEDSQVGLSLWVYSPASDSIRQVAPARTGTNWIRLGRAGDYLYGKSERGSDPSTVLLLKEGDERAKEIELPGPFTRLYHLDGERFVYDVGGVLYGLDAATGESELLNLVHRPDISSSLVGSIRGKDGNDIVLDLPGDGNNSNRYYRTDGTPGGTRLLFDIDELGLPNGFKRLTAALDNVFISVPTDTATLLYAYYPPTEELGQIDLPLAFGDFRMHPQEDHLFLFGVTPETTPFSAQYVTASVSAAPGGALRARVFRDVNGDGVAQANEPAMPNYAINYTGDGTAGRLFSNREGRGKLFTRAGVAYEVSPVAPPCYEITTDSNLVFVANPDSNVFFNIGFQPMEMGDPSVKGGIFPFSASRCGFQSRVAFRVVNNGCTDLENIEAFISIPENVTLMGTPVPSPATNIDNTLGWSIDSLKIGEEQIFVINLQMPGEEAVGQPISMGAEIEAFDPLTNAVITDTLVYTDTLRCAIDPNDKQVYPNRPEPSNSNYTRFDETLTYTVRFQNTGNDTAFTVRIEDQLPGDLDLETFKPLAASHPYTASLTEDGLATFLFEDILLPDSTTNQVKSNGFVSFEISTKPGLEEFTSVNNTAGIFFDFNAPVITNTVTSTLVEFLDEDMDGFFFWNECDDENEFISPGAPEIPGNGIDDDCMGGDAPVATWEPLPGRLEVFPNPTNGLLQVLYDRNTKLRGELLSLLGRGIQDFVFQRSYQLELAELPVGTYLLRLTDVQSGAVKVEKINVVR